MLSPFSMLTAADADDVYRLISEGRHEQALVSLESMQRSGDMSWDLKLQKGYLLLQLKRVPAAQAWVEELKAQGGGGEKLALLSAVVAERSGHYNQAYEDYKELERAPDPDVASQARAQLGYLPRMARKDVWLWSDLDAYGSYLGRYGMVVGVADLKIGTFVPGARWIQPYLELSYIGDTRSSSNNQFGRSSIYSQNLAGIHGGVRVRPLMDTNISIYVEGGGHKDLIDSAQHEGEWFASLQAGINGFESWGPGAVLDPARTDILSGRLDWFVDLGGDLSYYSRLPNTIGYLQSKQGLRVLQFGDFGAFDVYAVENVSFDFRGSYFDNFAEFGPGARAIFQPVVGMNVTLAAEYFNGVYWGRDDLGTRGSQDTWFDDVRVTCAVGWRW